jgi:hypothetical protein
MRLAFLAPLVGSASAVVIEHWWNISRALANPDGVSPYFPVVVNKADRIAFREISNRSQWIMAVSLFFTFQ